MVSANSTRFLTSYLDSWCPGHPDVQGIISSTNVPMLLSVVFKVQQLQFVLLGTSATDDQDFQNSPGLNELNMRILLTYSTLICKVQIGHHFLTCSNKHYWSILKHTGITHWDLRNLLYWIKLNPISFISNCQKKKKPKKLQHSNSSIPGVCFTKPKIWE